jgi:hypothetical protein
MPYKRKILKTKTKTTVEPSRRCAANIPQTEDTAGHATIHDHAHHAMLTMLCSTVTFVAFALLAITVAIMIMKAKAVPATGDRKPTSNEHKQLQSIIGFWAYEQVITGSTMTKDAQEKKLERLYHNGVPTAG